MQRSYSASRHHEPTPDYVAKGEWSRGLLRLYGHGEGENKDDTAKSASSPSGSTVSSNSDEQSATSPDVVWGFDLEGLGRERVLISEDHPGVLGADGRLKLDSDTIDQYVTSFMHHMYVMHPILDPRRLSQMVNRFKQAYSPVRPGPSLGKRKRDGDTKYYYGEYQQRQGPEQNYTGPRYPKIGRTIGNAIIVLILALGKICAYKGPLPGPVKNNASNRATSTPSSQPATLLSSSGVSSNQNSPSMPPIAPMDSHPSMTNDARPVVRNMDVIPGLAYFAWAIGVLGEHLGGSDLEHCQAFILAALYWGQLAHPFSSYAWIISASSACIGLIHRSSQLMSSIHNAHKNNNGHYNSGHRIQVDLIEICYWTCLQLESDIRAELKELQPTAISYYEDFMESNIFYPSAAAIETTKWQLPFDSTMISEYYLFQLYLRKHLNHTHSELYDPKNLKNRNFGSIEALFHNLESYRKVFAGRGWDDREPPAADILAARLRAKFYGGRNIILRPLLEKIMKEEIDAAKARKQLNSDDNYSAGSPSRPDDRSQPHSPAVTHLRHPNRSAQQQYKARLPQHHAFSQNLTGTEHPPLTDRERELAEIGIQSLIASTIAFDAVVPRVGRLIVTNIFGTLHAQFGNMLILAAAYQSPRLKAYVDRHELERLMRRTIKILEEHKDVSPTLREDALILEQIQGNLPPPTVSSGDSFSSHDT
ncbi:putative c6 zinc finger domain-containing protein [Phaeomoniella chlamydospora]|uniref:Putative c6 zinc finger domain-containing protein n=1 Tax=Phaeomoniella chlamydospora TaxID=158046 RepID=A0A0G2ER50_PHACM|nr:putative c6 zinc finger domain-containing protein [Phaeomoniella chlamydospora]